METKENKITLNKWFKNIYVIYIPSRENYIRNIIKELDIKVNFIPAILIEDLGTLDELLKKKLLSPYFFYKHLKHERPKLPIDLIKFENNINNADFIRGLKGKLALQLSYLKIFDLFLETSEKHCLIFEDDILLPKADYLERINNIFIELNNINWDYINFGRCFDMCEINTKFSENLIIDSYPLCTHACGYSRRICEELIVSSIPLRQAGDHIIHDFYYLNPKYKCYTVRPAIFFQNKTFKSTLGNSNKELPECGNDEGKKKKKLKK
jgi:hypothetical protein